MNRIRLIVLLPAALLAAQSWAAELVTVESRITDVTVYPDRAQVTRSADIDVTPGENRIVIDHLPATLEEDSVKAAGKASLQVVIQDIRISPSAPSSANNLPILRPQNWKNVSRTCATTAIHWTLDST